MDRRQVEHVEAHCGDVRQSLDDAGKAAVTLIADPAGTREQLVPGREARTLDVDRDIQHLVVFRDEEALAVHGHQRRQPFALRHGLARFGCGGRAQFAPPSP